MMRAMIGAGVLAMAASGAAAQDWAAKVTVSGAVEGVYDVSGTGHTMFEDENGLYFSADAYGEGVDAGRTCADVAFAEIDYFFGLMDGWETHVLFSYQSDGAGYEIIDPTIYFSPLRQNNVIDTYADFDTATVAITDLACLPDGRFSMAIAFKGQLAAGYGEGPEIVRLSGTSETILSMVDISEY